jgi:EAL domain-containing protein (putative c-di-GMP-specific phosphodiesterase class I)
VSIALDDVGFGRSCLESLILLEPHLIKVDKRCVQGAAHDRSRAHSLQRLLAMARTLGSDVVAEGIESQEDLKVLEDLGVPYGQGFLLGAPIEPRTSGLWETAEALPGVNQVR